MIKLFYIMEYFLFIKFYLVIYKINGNGIIQEGIFVGEYMRLFRNYILYFCVLCIYLFFYI